MIGDAVALLVALILACALSEWIGGEAVVFLGSAAWLVLALLCPRALS